MSECLFRSNAKKTETNEEKGVGCEVWSINTQKVVDECEKLEEMEIEIL